MKHEAQSDPVVASPVDSAPEDPAPPTRWLWQNGRWHSAVLLPKPRGIRDETGERR